MESALRRILQNRENSPLEGSTPQAAVALVLCGPGDELLLIRRADDPRDPWSGHMALPGGKRDADDHSLLATALRETWEEVGLRLGEEHLLGPLPPMRTRSRTKDSLWVAPYVFRLGEVRPRTTPNYEVAEIIWTPLAALTQPERETFLTVEHDGLSHRFPAWDVQERKVWGLTYAIVSHLLPIYEQALSLRAEGHSSVEKPPYF